jgi:hypothetical protein
MVPSLDTFIWSWRDRADVTHDSYFGSSESYIVRYMMIIFLYNFTFSFFEHLPFFVVLTRNLAVLQQIVSNRLFHAPSFLAQHELKSNVSKLCLRPICLFPQIFMLRSNLHDQLKPPESHLTD